MAENQFNDLKNLIVTKEWDAAIEMVDENPILLDHADRFYFCRLEIIVRSFLRERTFFTYKNDACDTCAPTENRNIYG